jgi:hypothetical protein
VRVPADLAGRVEVALARSVDQIPGPRSMPGGSRYEVKWDGYLHCPSLLDSATLIGVDQGQEMSAAACGVRPRQAVAPSASVTRGVIRSM